MTVVSGTFGAISGVGSVRNWTISKSSREKSLFASNTLGGARNLVGPQDWNGSFLLETAEPLVLPGDSLSFTGYQGPDNGTLNTAGQAYSGTVLIESVEITWDWGGGVSIETNVSFAGNGALSGPASATVTDTTYPKVYPVCNAKIQYGDLGGAFTDLQNVVSAKLTLQAQLQAYVDSSTGCWTKRVVGPKNWTAELVLNDVLEPLAVDAFKVFRFFIDATTYWELIWGRVMSYSNITVNPETGEVVSKTMSLAMDGFADSGNPTAGKVVSPSNTVWWKGTTA